HYLSILKLRRKEFIQNYQPTHWELLTPIERKKIIDKNLADRQEEQIEAQLEINNFFRLHRERKKIYRLKRTNLLTFLPTEYLLTKCLLLDPNAQNSLNPSHQRLEQGEGLVPEVRTVANPVNQSELGERIQKLTFKRIERAETNSDDPMEVDQPQVNLRPPPSSGVTPRHHAPEEEDWRK
ncbi:hypothetical protein VP01_3257g1, partial [Puccinia sorghi]